jgi:hypothetical protein
MVIREPAQSFRKEAALDIEPQQARSRDEKMKELEDDQAFASEVARRKQQVAQRDKRFRGLLSIGLLTAAAVGLTVWFREAPADRDHAHFGFALGLAAGVFFVWGMLGRSIFPKPNATCPRCGCDWEAESDNNTQTWLAWNACPRCGLQMTDDNRKQP